MTFRKLDKTKHGLSCLLYAMLVALIAVFSLMIFWLVWPYNDVYPTGSLTGSIVGEPSIERAGDITVKFDGFCDNSRNVVVTRWADLYGVGDDSSEIVAAYSLPPIEFYVDQESCQSPVVSVITIPNYVPPGTYRLRIITTYRANPIRNIDMTTYTEPFTIVPRS